MCKELAPLQAANFREWEILVNGTDITRERVMFNDILTYGRKPLTLNLSVSNNDPMYNVRAVFFYFPCQDMKESHPLLTEETVGVSAHVGARVMSTSVSLPEPGNPAAIVYVFVAGGLRTVAEEGQRQSVAVFRDSSVSGPGAVDGVDNDVALVGEGMCRKHAASIPVRMVDCFWQGRLIPNVEAERYNGGALEKRRKRSRSAGKRRRRGSECWWMAEGGSGKSTVLVLEGEFTHQFAEGVVVTRVTAASFWCGINPEILSATTTNE